MVDLDGAASGRPENLAAIKLILDSVIIPIELGGGLRDTGTVQSFLEMGIDRVVLGTAAVEDHRLVKELCQRYGPKIVIGIDARDGLAASHGWGKSSSITARDLAIQMAGLGAHRIIYTDISRDGTLTSPNFKAIEELLDYVKISVIASGGVASISHLKKLAEMGVEGVIVGKALYTGDIDLQKALNVLAKEKIMPHKFEVAKIDRLDSPERLKRLPSFEEVFSQLPLKPSQSVADIGCGTGTFSLPLAKHLPEGKLYCLDIAEEMLERVKKKIKENNISNVIVKKINELDFGLDLQSLDGVFMTFVLHEQEDRVAFLKAIGGLLKKGGWVGFVEWVKKEMPEGPPFAERIDSTEARTLATNSGMKVLKEKTLGDKFYMMVLGK